MIKLLKFKRAIFISIILVVSVASCAQENMNSQDNTIYKIAIETLFKEYNQLVLIDSTLIDTSEAYESYKEGDYEYFDFLVKAKEKKAISISPKIITDKNLTIISYDKFVEILETGSKNMWDNFYDKYPNSSGIVTISPIGYSKDSTKAWLEISNFKGGYSGFDAAIRMKKINGNWEISGEISKAYY